jgi:hypothetical protein
LRYKYTAKGGKMSNLALNRFRSVALVLLLAVANLLAMTRTSEARTMIRLESCKDAAAVFAAGKAEEEAASSQDVGVSCNSNYLTIQKIDEKHYQVQVSCAAAHFNRMYRVSVQRTGDFCGATNAKTVTYASK